MASQPEITNMALFCDFENVALGVRDAKYAQFDIKKVLERLLLKGSIVVKKAYCDWDRYKEFKATMHEAAFELIEIPHVRQSGKNSADIRMVVDALDLCYTKAHVDTFVIISGDSDFSPLVSKLRENNKYVIGIGVKDSTSDLLSANCDEFIFYDDLVREQEAKKKQAAKKTPAKVKAEARNRPTAKSEEDKRQEALDFLVETVEGLISERGSDEKIWGSMVKTTMQRRRPGFNESYLRLPLVQGTDGGCAEAQAACAGARREVGAVYDTVAGGGVMGGVRYSIRHSSWCSFLWPFALSLSKGCREAACCLCEWLQSKSNTVGGSPTASHFFLLRQRKSNQKEGDPGAPPLRGSLRCSTGQAAAELALRAQTVLADYP